MKFSFHRNPDPNASPNTLIVFQDEGDTKGQPATHEQVDAILQLLNMPESLAASSAPYTPGEVDEFLKPSGGTTT